MSDGLHNRIQYDFLELGICPVNEESDCPQIDDENYDQRAREWCKRYITQLRAFFEDYRKYDVTFEIRTNSHDFGRYYEVIVKFEKGSIGESYAYYIESNLPTNWEESTNEVTFEQWQEFKP